MFTYYWILLSLVLHYCVSIADKLKNSEKLGISDMKVLKVYLINCPNYSETQIYCIRHENGEDLPALKEKIYLRCPLLKTLTYEPQIYWWDLEHDKIIINCDDDLRFFMEESEVTKVTVDFGCSSQEHSMTRKRHLMDDECSDSSKRIRRKLQQIEIDSDSSMDTDDLIETEAEKIIVTSTDNNNEESIVPSTSSDSSNVNILSVEIIKSTDEIDANVDNSQQNEATVEQHIAQEQGTSQQAVVVEKKRKNSDSNKIVISDSSDDDEEDEALRRNRRHSDGNYFSSYSFAGAGTTNNNNDRFESRASFDDDFRHYRNNRYFHQQYRNRFREEHAANIARMLQNAQAMRQSALRNAEAIRENTLRNIRNSTNNIFPNILQTFQAHFRPLFQSHGFTNHQQFSRSYRH